MQSAFENLPVSTEQVLHPAKYWDPKALDWPVRVQHEATELPGGWKVAFSDCLGEMLLALCTLPRTQKVGPIALMGMRYTHREASGWGGDRVSLLQQGERRMLVWDLIWDRPKDADEFWAAMAPEDTSTGESAASSSSGSEARLDRQLLRMSPDHIRWVAWLDTPREEALKVASKVQYSRLAWGKIADPGVEDGVRAPARTDPTPGEPKQGLPQGPSHGDSRKPGF